MTEEIELTDETLAEEVVLPTAGNGGNKRYIEAQISAEADDGDSVQLGLYAEKSYLLPFW